MTNVRVRRGPTGRFTGIQQLMPGAAEGAQAGDVWSFNGALWLPAPAVAPDELLRPRLFDDFQSGGAPIVNPGAGTVLVGGLGETGWLGVFVSITAGTAWEASAAGLNPGEIGVAQLGGLAGAGDVSAICRGYSATSPVCHVRDIQRLEYLVTINNQGALAKFGYLGLNNNWASLSGLMGVQSNTPTVTNWVLRRSGVADLDTGVSALSVGAEGDPFFIRFEQRQDEATGLGSGRWDLYIASEANPDVTTPVVEDFDGGAVGGDPDATTNYGAQVQFFSTAVNWRLDAIEFVGFERSLADRLRVT